MIEKSVPWDHHFSSLMPKRDPLTDLFVYALLFVLSSFAIIFKRKRESCCFAFIVLRMSCYCKSFVTLPHGAVGWSALCDCGISWSYSLFVSPTLTLIQYFHDSCHILYYYFSSKKHTLIYIIVVKHWVKLTILCSVSSVTVLWCKQPMFIVWFFYTTGWFF